MCVCVCVCTWLNGWTPWLLLLLLLLQKQTECNTWLADKLGPGWDTFGTPVARLREKSEVKRYDWAGHCVIGPCSRFLGFCSLTRSDNTDRKTWSLMSMSVEQYTSQVVTMDWIHMGFHWTPLTDHLWTSYLLWSAQLTESHLSVNVLTSQFSGLSSVIVQVHPRIHPSIHPSIRVQKYLPWLNTPYLLAFWLVRVQCWGKCEIRVWLLRFSVLDTLHVLSNKISVVHIQTRARTHTHAQTRSNE